MLNIEIVKRFYESIAECNKVVFKRNGSFYVASKNKKGDIIIFDSNVRGDVTNWSGVYETWTYEVTDQIF